MTESITSVKTTKQKVYDFIYHNWQVVLIIGLLIGIVMLWQLNQSTKAEVLKLQSALVVKEKVEAIDAKLTEMQQREKVLYPQLQQKLSDLEKTRQDLKAAEARLKAPDQGAIRNEVNKLSETEVNRLFHDLGYDTEIRGCK